MKLLIYIAFAIVNLVKHRDKTVVLTLVACIVLFGIGVKLQPTTSEGITTGSTKKVKTKEIVTNKVTPEKKAKTAIEQHYRYLTCSQSMHL